MKLSEFIKKQEDGKILTFLPTVERELVFNINAYKLRLVFPLEKVRRPAMPEEMLSTSDQRKWHDFDKELNNVDTIYIISKADFEMFDKEKNVEGDKWIYKNGSLFPTITNPIFHKKILFKTLNAS